MKLCLGCSLIGSIAVLLIIMSYSLKRAMIALAAYTAVLFPLIYFLRPTLIAFVLLISAPVTLFITLFCVAIKSIAEEIMENKETEASAIILGAMPHIRSLEDQGFHVKELEPARWLITNPANGTSQYLNSVDELSRYAGSTKQGAS